MRTRVAGKTKLLSIMPGEWTCLIKISLICSSPEFFALSMLVFLPFDYNNYHLMAYYIPGTFLGISHIFLTSSHNNIMKLGTDTITAL